MPVVQAVDIDDRRPPPFRLPALVNRGDVARRLAAIDDMDIDDAGEDEPAADGAADLGDDIHRQVLAGGAAQQGAGGAPPLAIGRAVVPPTRRDDRPLAPDVDASVDAASVDEFRTENRKVEKSRIDTTPAPDRSVRDVDGRALRDQDVDGTAGRDRVVDRNNDLHDDRHDDPERADDGSSALSRVRAAAAVPSHVRLPGDGPGSVSYAADDWRGNIKGITRRVDGRVYRPRDSDATDIPAAPTCGPAPLEATPDPVLPGLTPAGPVRRTPASAEVGPGQTDADEHADEDHRVSRLGRAARVGVVVLLVAILVVLFFYGPKIDEWWHNR
jgi:hypothetical protein